MKRPWWSLIPGIRRQWEAQARGAYDRYTEVADRLKLSVKMIQSLRWVIEDVIPELRHAKAAGLYRPKELPEDDGCPEIDYLIERCERALRGDAT